MYDLAKNILISAGELSGDMHAANLVQAVKKIAPNVRFYGMGADLMQKAGVDVIIDTKDLSIIGALEIIIKFVKILRAFCLMKRTIYRDKPDLLILVDYPGFNLRLAKIAKKVGVKVLYFISPKVWAWNQGRIKTIKKYVDMMAVIFPFEVAFYQKRQVPVKFVGNPLLKLAIPKLSVSEARELFKLNANYRTIGIFPGSRLSEIRRLLPVMIKAAKILKDNNPNIQFLLSQASSITDEDLKPYLQSNMVNIQVIAEKNYDIMQVCDTIIAASGTTTLEITLMEIPLVIVYKMSWCEYLAARCLIKIPYVGLCNILANKKIAVELLQGNATPKKISQEVEKILNNNIYRNEMISNLKEVRKLLRTNEQEEVSLLVLKMIGVHGSMHT
jgi:lipid-A-disaccharide synthase